MRKEKIMKKVFVSPKVNVMNIAPMDIICTSGVTPHGGLNTGGSIPVLPPNEVHDPIHIW